MNARSGGEPTKPFTPKHTLPHLGLFFKSSSGREVHRFLFSFHSGQHRFWSFLLFLVFFFFCVVGPFFHLDISLGFPILIIHLLDFILIFLVLLFFSTRLKNAEGLAY